MLFRKEASVEKADRSDIIPGHIGIIMDGNGRWAKRRGLPRTAGHTAGAANFKTIARHCNSLGVKCLTVYAFSSENWKRPEAEVNALMKLFSDYLADAKSYADENIKLKFIGDRSGMNEDIVRMMEENERSSENATGLELNIAINYGGRAEIAAAVNRCLEKNPETQISEKMISDHLWTTGYADVDLLIRTGGELRISNFLIWQSAYAELVFSKALWPDFKTKDLDLAIQEFRERSRRFGGL